MEAAYDDGRVRVDETGVTLRAYYFPFGSRRLPFGEIQDVAFLPRFSTGRIWGSDDFRHWAPLDRKRLSRRTAVLITPKKGMKPVITPDDSERVFALIKEKIGPREEAP